MFMWNTFKMLPLYLLIILPALMFGQEIRFEASSDARQVVLGGYFTVEFTLHNASGEDFVAPSFRDFEVLSGPNESRSVSLFNGKRTQSLGLSYTLQPKKIGKFNIGRASVKVDGQTLSTRPFSIEVVKGRNSTASTKEELDAELGEGIYIKAIPNKIISKIGEQIIIDYKLYTSRNIESYNLVSESEYPGFFVHEMRRFNSRQIQEVIDGIQYTTKLIKKVALFPQQAGIFNIEPIVMNISIAVGNSRSRSIFSMPKLNTFRVSTEPLELKVEPLKEEPANFSGAVGKFEMRATVNRNQLTTDDAISMRMYITGNGDIKQVQAPQLGLSDKFEVYDPKVIEESSFESNNELSGKKVFEYLLLPKEPGDYTLRPTFSYFDTDSLKFVTLESESFPVTVKKGTIDRTQKITEATSNPVKEDIRFIKMAFSLDQDPASFIGSGLFWTLFVFPFLLFGGLIVLRQVEAGRANMDMAVLKRKKAVKVAQKKLAQAKKYMESGDSKAFYDEVSRASFGYVCDKLNIAFSELTKQNVKDKLSSLEVKDASIERFMDILKTCEMALFAGKDNAAAMQDTYKNAIDIIAEIEEQIET